MSDAVLKVLTDDALVMIRRSTRAEIEAKIAVYKARHEGASEEELAEALGVSKATVGNWARAGKAYFLNPPEREEEELG